MAVAKYRMAEMTWPELRDAVQEGRIAVMPTGIIEQHGPHLPLDTDIFLAQQISEKAAAKVPDKVVLVPPVVHGHSPHHMDFPGTLSVAPLNMINYVLDVCMSLSQHGFKKILMVNGHGSNMPVLDLVARQTIIQSKGEAACAVIFYMHSEEYERAALELFPEMSGRSGHADAVETALYLGLRPDLVQLDKARDDFPKGVMNLGTARLPLRIWWSALSKEGIYGKVAGVTQAKGEKLVAAAVDGLANVFLEYHEKQIPARVDHH